MLHVEVVQNDWSSGEQRVVARLTLTDSGSIDFASLDNDRWRPIVFQVLTDPASGERVTPDADPERFLRLLHNRLSGDYVFATEARDDNETEPAVGAVVPMQVTPIDTHVAEPAHH